MKADDKTKKILFIIYPGFELLDLSGPMSVFATANALSNTTLYELDTRASSEGLVQSGAGLSVYAKALEEANIDSRSTALVVGANTEPLQRAAFDTNIKAWLQAHAHHAERYGSICSGTFVLALAGLLENKTVTTHWAGCDQLKALPSSASVLNDDLYHIDGRCWTSAGVTTGIDMALEMVKRDHGKALMQQVAKYLVVYSQRPGKQSQFSQIQDMRPNEEDHFAKLITWLKQEVTRPVKIDEMADFMCMSSRSFQRKFTKNFSISPARFYERMRMEHARDFLLPNMNVESAARSLNYQSVAAFRTSFEKHFGLSPSTSKRLN